LLTGEALPSQNQDGGQVTGISVALMVHVSSDIQPMLIAVRPQILGNLQIVFKQL
jgi:hypothetical protein